MKGSITESAPTAEQLLKGIASYPLVVALLEELKREFTAMRADEAKRQDAPKIENGWIDAKKAAEYLDMSPNTFDKHRYQSEPKLKGCQVGGKTLYKKSDLDVWVKLWAVKSGGLA